MLNLSCFFEKTSSETSFQYRLDFNARYEFHEFLDEEDFTILLDGEVYNFNEITPRETSVSLQIYQAVKSGRLAETLRLLDGSFTLIVVDKEKSKVILASDRFGSRFLYFQKSKFGLRVADKVNRIVTASGDQDIDRSSVQQFMELGYVLEDSTLFNSVKLIQPATIVTFDLNRAGEVDKIEEHYWSWSSVKRSSISFDEAVEKLGTLFDQAVRRRFDPNKRIGASLSGGLDSRANVASIKKQFPNYKGVAFTFGVPNCDDIKIAQKVSSLAGWKHVVFHFSDKNWFSLRQDRVLHTDGLQDIKHMHGSEFLPLVKEHVDINFNGYAGDVIAGGGFLGRLPVNTRATPESIETFFKSFTDQIDVSSHFYDIESCEPVVLANRVRRFTTMGVINSMTHIQPRMPFLDKDFLEFVYSLPEEYRYRNLIYSKMLVKNYPDFFADIPWQKTGKKVGLTPKVTFFYKVRNRLKQYYSRLIKKRRNKEYTDYANWIRNPVIYRELSDLLDRENSYISKYIQTDYRKEYLEPHMKNPLIDHSDRILRFATLEVYFRKVLS